MSAEHAELLGSFMVPDMLTTTSLSVNNIQALYKKAKLTVKVIEWCLMQFDQKYKAVT